jgi:hypothetical protein
LQQTRQMRTLKPHPVYVHFSRHEPHIRAETAHGQGGGGRVTEIVQNAVSCDMPLPPLLWRGGGGEDREEEMNVLQGATADTLVWGFEARFPPGGLHHAPPTGTSIDASDHSSPVASLPSSSCLATRAPSQQPPGDRRLAVNALAIPLPKRESPTRPEGLSPCVTFLHNVPQRGPSEGAGEQPTGRFPLYEEGLSLLRDLEPLLVSKDGLHAA